jgi:hypothetical protein
VKQFETVFRTIHEQIDIAASYITTHLVMDKTAETENPFAHVCIAAAQEVAHVII